MANSFLALWHKAIQEKDYKLLQQLLDENVVFRTPLYLKPRKGSSLVTAILASASTIFKDFVYHRELKSDDGRDYILEFEATVEGKTVKGVDIIRLDAGGKIVEFEVMMRPVKTVARFGELQAIGIPKMIAALGLDAKL
ncbi:hypothetical protein HDU91_003067 [Kappamyces sp. JEL0680]|nr:hypothetical protein HDU91_003067 [Kappamyces sp. JEL0680]